eukprot:TRINITY_DN40205_c0_g1_i1.p1 TRINITY_DN40205_c0_g1~~TRINITY_DN40205_c0_g1_i1.p1  ORF type:complete len:298 (+),score=23.93 TRINITY_DN40205_c0_g1_i1:67-960(+)
MASPLRSRLEVGSAHTASLPLIQISHLFHSYRNRVGHSQSSCRYHSRTRSTGRLNASVSASLTAINGRRFSLLSWTSGIIGVLLSEKSAPVTIAMAATGGDREGAFLATRRGMQKFSQADIAGSIEEFDRALQLDPSQKPYLWQRGLSLYYANRFADGSAQFREDVAVNPNDTEEAIWSFLCEAQLTSPEEARQQFLQVGRDSRPVMRAAYELFKSGGSTKELEGMAARDFLGGHDAFYARLYLGLFHEAEKNTARAQEEITAALRTRYGSSSGDYMARLATVHAKCRGWPVPGSSA